MKQEHHPWHLSSFGEGANTSDDKEAIGSQPLSGTFIEGKNGRPGSTDGNNTAHEKIKGEVIKYPNAVVGTYKCIGSIEVNNHIVEYWASAVPSEDPYCRIDGVVVLQSPLFDIDINWP